MDNPDGAPAPRSYLYVPGSSADKLAKALSLGADAVIVDLEDGVARDRKAQARAAVGDWLATLDGNGPNGTEVWVRINAGATGATDLAAVFGAAVTGICLPKVSGPDDVVAVQAQLRQLELKARHPSKPLALQPLIETASGVLGAEGIARVKGVRRLQLGEVDLGSELGIERGSDESEFLLARSQLVLASAAAGIGPPVGPVSVHFGDLERFRASTSALKRLGYRSRACIHPAQVRIANEVFTPTPAEIDRARALVKSFDQAVAQGSGVWRDADGAMVDEAVVRAARRLLEQRE